MSLSANCQRLLDYGIVIDWDMLYVGWIRNWLVADDLIHFAVEYWAQDQSRESPELTALAIGNPLDRYKIDCLLLKLLDTLNGPAEEYSDRSRAAFRKWLCPLLRQCLSSAQSDRQLLDEVESIYADLEYPPDMAHFVPYMPAAAGFDPTMYTAEQCLTLLVQQARKFLEEEEQRLVEVRTIAPAPQSLGRKHQ